MNETMKDEGKKKSQWCIRGQIVMPALTEAVNGVIQLLHGMRVSFGLTLYDHRVFGVNNMLLH